jgi:thiamine-monophosphate kinase
VREFDDNARLFRPLAFGAPEAQNLQDDAAVIPSRPGYDLVVTKDAMVEGVHFLPGDTPPDIARKLLRVNLSDLAAKGAEPDAAILAVAWPAAQGAGAREAFAAGLAEDLQRFGLVLLGGDTVSTPGPLTASLTALGWVEAGRMVRRAGARVGDRLLVSGTIGDGGLGLKAAQGGLAELAPTERLRLLKRYRLPEPRLDLRMALLANARAAADVSDGLLADAGHIGEASGLGLRLRLDDLPLSSAASAWLAAQPDEAAARAWLASAGDDYEIVCTAPAQGAAALVAAGFTEIGEVVEGQGVQASFQGRPRAVAETGWTHS